MVQRWISAAVAIPLFLGLIFWGELPFAVGVFVLACLALGELLRGFAGAGIRVNLPAAVMGLVVPAWVWCAERDLATHSAGNIVSAGLLWLLAAMVWEVVLAGRTGDMQAARNLAYGLLCGIYVALFAGMVWLRSATGGVVSGSSDHSPLTTHTAYPLLLTLFSVWATDSFAYFTGKAVGKHKLAPKLSPGKTVEGTAGGLAASLIVGALFGWLFFRNAGLGLAIGAIAGVFGQIGDLFESALKRELGIKDLGGILPGHGGVVDRFDSLLFVAPLCVLLLRYWPYPV